MGKKPLEKSREDTKKPRLDRPNEAPEIAAQRALATSERRLEDVRFSNVKLENAESIRIKLSEAKNPISLYKKAVEILSAMEKNFGDALGKDPYHYFDGKVTGIPRSKTEFEIKARELNKKAHDLYDQMRIGSALYILAKSKMGFSSVDEKEVENLTQNLLDTQSKTKRQIEQDLKDGILNDPAHSILMNQKLYALVQSNLKALHFDNNDPLVREVQEKRAALLKEKDIFPMSEDEFHTYFSGQLEQSAFVGDCYLIAALHAFSFSPNFEIMVRSSVRHMPDGSWEVKIPLMNRENHVIKITPDELAWKFNNPLKRDTWGNITYVPITTPVDANIGFQVLEAAYMKNKFGTVDRIKSFGGFSKEALTRIGGNNFKEVSLVSFSEERGPAYLEHFLKGFHREGFIVTVNSKDEGFMGLAYKSKKRWEFFVPNHAYSVLDVDSNKQLITMANPWDTKKPFQITFEEFCDSFDRLSVIKIDHGRMHFNMATISVHHSQ